MSVSIRVIEARKFYLGALVMTQGIDALFARGFDPVPFLRRHASGDWGDICDEDKQANENALVHGDRLFSAYNVSLEDATIRIYVITEWDRSVTTFLLPSEY